MAKKTLVSIDDMIKEYRSSFDFAARKVQEIVDGITVDSSNIYDSYAEDALRSRIDFYVCDLPGMISMISKFSFDDEFYNVEMKRVSNLRHDPILIYYDHRIAYWENLRGDVEVCQNN